jgi:transcriptional regulator with XRE-family HTH domain
MAAPRTRPIDVAIARLRQQMQRLGQDAKSLRLGVGWTQAAVGSRAGVSQASVARLEAGNIGLAIPIVVRIFATLGQDLPLRAYPGDGVGLRDSGQLPMAEVVRARAHPSFAIRFEDPTGEGRQAADVVLLANEFGIHIELEAGLSVFEGQLRRAQLKRDALQRRHGRRLALVLALRDTERNRTAVAAHLGVMRAALPASSREVLRAIERGLPLARDGLLWIRPPTKPRARAAAN